MAIEALLAAPGPEDGIAVLLAHPDAFNDEQALTLLDSNIQRVQADAELRGLLENRRYIISEFQRAGVEGASAAMRGGPSTDELINDWLACDGWVAVFRFLEAHSAQLLTDDGAARVDAFAEHFANDPQGGPKLAAYRALLAVAHGEGIVAARRWLCRQLLSTLTDPDRPLTPDAQLAHYQALLALTDKDEDREAWIALNVNCGTLLRSLGREPEAIGHFETALEVVDEAGSPQHFSGIHRSLGNIYNDGEAADDDKAIHHYTLALRTLTAQSDPASYLHVHHMLGNLLQSSGQNASAIGHYRAALSVTPGCNPDQEAQVAADLADILTDDFGQTRQISLRESIDRLEQALRQLDKVADGDRWARAHRNLGMAYRDIESADRPLCLQQAIEHTTAAMTVWTRQQNPYGWAQLMHNLGTVRFLQRAGDLHDNLVQAIDHYRQALAIHTREQYPRDWALTQSSLGMCYLMLHELSRAPEDIDAAIELIGQSLQWWAGDGDDGTADSRKLQAEAANALGNALVERASDTGNADLEQGIKHMQEAESLYAAIGMQERRRSVLMNLARAYSLLSEADPDALPRAMAIARRAIEATPRDTDAYSWAVFQRNYAALLANAGDPALCAGAISALRGALEVFSRERFPGEFSVTQGFIGHVRFLERDWQGAFDAYARAVDAIAEVVSKSYTEAGQHYQIAESSLYFMRAAYCLVELGRPAEALVMLDRGKGRALSLDMAVAAALAGASRDDQALSAAYQQVAALEAEMSQAPRHLGRRSDAQLGVALRAARQALQTAIDAAQLAVRPDLELDDILAAAPPGGALLALLVTSQGSVAFVLPGGVTALSPEHVLRFGFTTTDLHAMLLGDEQVPGLVRTYLRARASADPAEAAQLHESYRTQLNHCCAVLWRDMLGATVQRLRQLDVADGAPLCLLPQGGLGLLPLHAACDTAVPPGEAGRWPLLERYAVSYAPSVYLLSAARRELRNNEQPEEQAASLFAAINPTGDLPFAETEGALLADLFARHCGGANPPTVLRGIRATVRNVKPQLSQHTYLHFACHGSFNFRDAGRSSLFLAGGQPLELAELMGRAVDLTHSRLVVLSACETGITEFQRSPDEYIGLPATFLKAGAPTVLSTLWEVNDMASAILVVDFYRRHIIDGAAPAEALRQAQLWIARASRRALVEWIEQGSDALRRRYPGGSQAIAKLVSELDAARERIAHDTSADMPFNDPWFWAGFCLSGA